MKRLTITLATALAVSSCASPNVDVNDPGLVSGKLMVFWTGYDEFVYFPLWMARPSLRRLCRMPMFKRGRSEP